MPAKLWIGAFVLTVYPVIAAMLFAGGCSASPRSTTSAWGGLMLTLVVAVVGMAGSLPLGILLALGRRSNLPAVRGVGSASSS